MHVHGFKIPDPLCRLIESGVWPDADTPSEEIWRQNLQPILGREAAQALSPDDDRIVMMKPPFHTVADEAAGSNGFWTSFVTNPNEIDYQKAVIIADFGIGSDSPIILYYSNPDEPVIMYLRWSGNGKLRQQAWIQTHDSFDAFAVAIGLPTTPN